MTIKKLLQEAEKLPNKDQYGREVIPIWKHEAIVEDLKNEIKEFKEKLRQSRNNTSN